MWIPGSSKREYANNLTASTEPSCTEFQITEICSSKRDGTKCKLSLNCRIANFAHRSHLRSRNVNLHPPLTPLAVVTGSLASGELTQNGGDAFQRRVMKNNVAQVAQGTPLHSGVV